MPEVVNPAVVDAVTAANFKAVAEQVAVATNLMMHEAVAGFGRRAALADAYLAVALKNAHEIDPSEAIANVKALTGNDAADQLSKLLAALASGQQASKVAGNTPPVTP